MSILDNIGSLTCVDSSAGHGLWTYHTDDNIGSLTYGSLGADYFAAAYKYKVRAGDVILGTYHLNAASSWTWMFSVPMDWDSNGGSVIRVSRDMGD